MIKCYYRKESNQKPKFQLLQILICFWSIPITNGTIPPRSFVGFIFDYADIYPRNLKKIHVDAFEESSFLILILSPPNGSNMTELENFPGTEYDLYQSLVNIHQVRSVQIQLDNSAEHIIPDDVFVNTSFGAFHFAFAGNFTISRIGENFLKYYDSYGLTINGPSPSDTTYYLITIRVGFFNVTIESISPSAFKAKPCSECYSDYIFRTEIHE